MPPQSPVDASAANAAVDPGQTPSPQRRSDLRYILVDSSDRVVLMQATPFHGWQKKRGPYTEIEPKSFQFTVGASALRYDRKTGAVVDDTDAPPTFDQKLQIISDCMMKAALEAAERDYPKVDFSDVRAALNLKE